MPAISVSDITVLPRIFPRPSASARKVVKVTTAPQGFEGEGFPVRRMHDRNKAGWYVLIPLFNIYLLATPGDTGNNRFGGKPEKF